MKEALALKLLAIQKEIKAIPKEENNPFFKSKYFDINGLLAILKPILNANGVVVLQPLTVSAEGKNQLTTDVMDAATGDFYSTSVLLPELSDVQKLGAAITYMRRYALSSLFLLEAEDDDGNSAAAKPATSVAAQAATTPTKSTQICPKCGKAHTGQYPTCLECYKAQKAS